MTQNNKAYRYSVVDDDNYACSRLISLVDRVNENLKLSNFYSYPKKAHDLILADEPDVLFLDVEMPLMDGMELCASLREQGFKGKIVFTTSFNQYILKALRVRAFDYLLKPIDEGELKQCIDRLLLELSEGYQNFAKLGTYGLSEREIDVAKKIFMGLTSKEIGEELFISKHTVDTHRRNMLQKTGCKNTHELFKLI
jgi:DNA-binding NarL/FixJ family response regulator